MSAGEELKEGKLTHWCALIRNLDVIQILMCNHNYQKEREGCDQKH